MPERQRFRETNGPDAVVELEAQLAACTDDAESASLRVKLSDTRAAVRSDKLGEVAAKFEAVAQRGAGP